MIKHLLLLTVIIASTSVVAEAQLRKSVDRSDGYTGAVVQTDREAGVQSWNNESPTFRMSHSYSMSFGSFGGQFQNLNAYTNHMDFDLSERLSGQVDVSLLHSPFGNSFLTGGATGGPRILIDNARLDYELSPKSSISVQFSQRPYYSPYSRYRNYYSSGLNPYWD